MRASEEAKKLWPYLLPMIQRSISGGGGSGGGATPGVGGAPSPHGISSAHHTGTLANSQAPQFLLLDGSRTLTGNMAVDSGITIDGVDLSAHVADPDAHHDRATAGNTAIGVTGQAVSLLLSGSDPGVEISSGLRVKNYYGINRDANGISVKPHYGIQTDSNGVWVKLKTNSGQEVDTNGLALGTPTTLAHDTANSVTTSSHVHAVSASSDVGSTPAAALLKSNGSGQLTLAQLTLFGNLIFSGGDRNINASNNLTISPSTDLILDPTGLIVLPNAQEMRTGTFSDLVTGIAGFRMWDRGSNYRQITTGAGKFDELYVRVFVADEVRIDRGEEYWSKSYGVVEEDFVMPDDEDTVDVWFENSPALAAANLFSVGDWLLARTIDWDISLAVEKIWFTVVSLLTAGSVDGYRQQWRIKRENGGTTGSIVKKGNVLLDAGQVGQGWIHLSALEQDGGPFIQMGEFTSVVSGDTPQHTNYVRLGNLNGTVDYSADAWGLAAGTDGTDGIASTPSTGFSGFAIDGDNGMRLFNTSLLMYTGSTLTTSLTNANGLRFVQDSVFDSNPNRYIEWFSTLTPISDANRRGTIRSAQDSGKSVMQIFSLGGSSADASLQIGAQGNSKSSNIQIGTGTNTRIDLSADIITMVSAARVGSTSAPASPLHVYEDTSNTSSNAGITIEQDGTGDAVIQFLLTAAQRWVMGVDNSDSDRFKISRTADVGSNPVFALDTSDNIYVRSNLRAMTSSGLALYDDGGNLGVFIEDGGDVGIGTASIAANARLHVYNASAMSRVMVETGASADASIVLTTPSGVTFVGNPGTAGGIINGSGAADFTISARSGGAIRISADTGFEASEGISLFENGQLAIGVTSLGGASRLGVRAGTSSNDFAPSGSLTQQITDVGNSGSSETTLWSYSVPASTLANNGDSLYFELAVEVANTAHDKTLKIKFGSQTAFDATFSDSGEKIFRGRIIRTGAATQKFWIDMLFWNTLGGSGGTMDYAATLTQTLSGALTFAITGQNSVATSNEIVLRWAMLDYRPANS